MGRRRLPAPARRLKLALKLGAAASTAKNPVPLIKKPHAKRYRFTMAGTQPAAGSDSEEAEQVRETTGATDDPDAQDEPELDEEAMPKSSGQEEPNELASTRSKTYNLRRIVQTMKSDMRAKEVSEELHAWSQAARNLGRELTMFLCSSVAFSIGLDIATEDDTELNDDDDVNRELYKDLTPTQIQTFKEQCEVILDSMPNLRADIDELLENPTALGTYARYIDNRVRAARGDDLSSLQKKYLMFIAALKENKNAKVPHLIRKSERGFTSVYTGRLLCPQDQLDVFDANPDEYCTQARNGNGPDADDLPSFLFDPEMTSEADPLAGFLRGPFLEMCFKNIMTGPSSAVHGRASTDRVPGRPPIAAIYGFTEVRPHQIAYVAVLARFVLNSETQWNNRESALEMAEFHQRIVSVFESKTFSEDTIKWWNGRVYGNKPPAHVVTDTAPRPGSMAAKIAARIAAQVAAEAGG